MKREKVKQIVISMGGSLLYPQKIDSGYVKKFSQLVKKLSKEYKIAIVTGGGKLARNYIQVARETGANEVFCDFLGIGASRMNARLLATMIGEKATPQPPLDLLSALKELNSGKILVMGGTHPGHSTDAVAALLAEAIQADLLINATNVSGIYDKNPKIHKKSKLYQKVSPDQLVDLVKNKSIGAGKYELLDILAVKVVQRSNIPLVVLNGKNLENLKKAIEGKKFLGTLVKKA